MAHEIYTAVVMDAALFDMEMLWLYNCSWKSLEINFREILLSNIKSIGYCLLFSSAVGKSTGCSIEALR